MRIAAQVRLAEAKLLHEIAGLRGEAVRQPCAVVRVSPQHVRANNDDETEAAQDVLSLDESTSQREHRNAQIHWRFGPRQARKAEQKARHREALTSLVL